MSSRAGRTSEKRLKDSGKGKGKGSSVVSSVGGGRNPEQAKELGKATGEDESAMMSSARGDRTPEKQAKDTHLRHDLRTPLQCKVSLSGLTTIQAAEWRTGTN